jgi:cob(I)alamin adenosyltransferase
VRLKKGCVHLYVGDGKGKTTAALGLLVRAHGAGLSCLFVQFLKGQQTSELASLEALGIPYLRTGEVKKFIPYMNQAELLDCREDNARCFRELVRTAAEQKPDCIVLDEVLDAVSTGMLSEEALVQFVESVKPHAEVVITGRNPGERVVALADYMTEMKKHKHPYEQGVTARRGIEY